VTKSLLPVIVETSYGVLRVSESGYGEIWRRNMTREEAVRWVEEFIEDGCREGAFVPCELKTTVVPLNEERIARRITGRQ
jgi:hypothetical protein